tara:strand:+ start:19161 stop:19919 length:759 start_codon:yes stop_codon:yes gene_type:complete
MTDDHSVYDPERPWIADEMDDPSRANWVEEFLVPFGRTRKPIFLRGQMFLALLRIVILPAAIIANFIAGPAIGAAIGFGGLFVLLFASIISHSRRLNDSGRPTLFASLIALPLIIASVLVILGTINAPIALEQMQKQRAAAAAERAATIDGDETTEGAGNDAIAEAENAEAVPAPTGPPQRGRRGPPMTEEMLVKGAVMQSLGAWFLLSLFGMLFSFLYVARGETIGADGINKKRRQSEYVPQPGFRSEFSR